MTCANKIGVNSFYDEGSITNFSKRDIEIEECLKTLEDWIVALLNNAESRSNISKLRYCYWCVNTMRAGLYKCGLFEYSAVSNSVITMSEHLQNVLNSSSYMKYSIDSLSTMPIIKGHHFLSPISRKCCSSKRKIKRKCRSHKRPKDNESVKKIYSTSKQYRSDIQYLIDQLYIQARTVLAENCFDDVHILKELGNYIDNNVTSKEGTVSRTILSTDKVTEDCQKYPSQLWSGDCKINGDSRDNFSDSFYPILDSNSLDVGSFNDRKFQRYKKSSVGSHRSRLKRDSDFDEGFSENEFIDDVGSGFIFNRSAKPVSKECLRYCGDCDYNSSNSKLYEDVHKDVTRLSDIGLLDCVCQDDDASESDGGTEILNSVNATVNKFNAIMQYNVNEIVDDHIDNKIGSVFIADMDHYVCDQWTNCHSKDQSHSSINHCEQKHIAPIMTESTLSSLINPSSTYKEEHIESPSTSILAHMHCPVYQHNQHMPTMATLSNINGDTLSKMMVSPISLPNWCSFNCNYLPARSFNYYNKQNKNYDSTNSSSDNYDIQKLSTWLPCISNSVTGTNSYHVTTNHRQQQHQQPQQQQQLHQILLSPQLSLPPINLNSIPHNIIHLPQIFHQSQHSVFDADYLDRRFAPINPTLFPGPNNNHNSGTSDHITAPPSCSSSSSSSLTNTIVTNTNNHSNIATPKNHLCHSIFKASLDKSQRACCFYMRGGCKKEDCEYAHDLSKVTCKFWEKGDCFKSDTCPFKHGYHKL